MADTDKNSDTPKNESVSAETRKEAGSPPVDPKATAEPRVHKYSEDGEPYRIIRIESSEE
jgi:hypothetical protein